MPKSEESAPGAASEPEGDEKDNQEQDVASNKFANDGSFLEMFKRLQDMKKGKPADETKNDVTKEDCSSSSVPSNATSTSSGSNPALAVKRRKVLKVGVIKRQKKVDEPDEEDKSGDAWTKYLNEVRKYKEKYGDDSDKNRPLVK